MIRRNVLMSFWYDADYNHNMLGFISKGHTYYGAFLGNIFSSDSRPMRINGKFQNKTEAREAIEKRIRKYGIPYVVRSGVDEYFNGDHCRLKFEHYDWEGNCVNKYYEANGSLNRYIYYTVNGRDYLYARKD